MLSTAIEMRFGSPGASCSSQTIVIKLQMEAETGQRCVRP